MVSALDLARQKVAQAWCTPTTGNITMIPEIAFAFADILEEVMNYAHVELDENLDYRRTDDEGMRTYNEIIDKIQEYRNLMEKRDKSFLLYSGGEDALEWVLTESEEDFDEVI